MTRKEAVLRYLIWAKKTNRAHRIGKDFVRGGWTPLWILRRPSIGGSAADVRLRELRRENGIPIEKRAHIDHKTGKETNTFLYRIAGDPDRVDIEHLRMRSGADYDRIKKAQIIKRPEKQNQLEIF